MTSRLRLLSLLAAPLVAALALGAGAPSKPAPANIPIASGKAGDTLAVFYSGDGGWRAIDQKVAQHLADNGVPTIGVDSLTYFRTRRSADGAARDLADALRQYEARWGRTKVVLIGYSFGADALPAIIPHLPADLRAHVDRLVLIGAGPNGDLQFHPVSWLNLAAADSFPVRPAIDALKNLKITCVYGDQERNDICPTLSDAATIKVRLPGDHHFNRDYGALAAAVLKASL
ncbi:AcvB/VirJ family lysyl-phosphatidylglycerol hydrolase [Caulobacter sp.]|uniref:AcvB/VirJ family lysyl-phosphatidylglycerol hydrolase n=1 Tax=Caulobacter sp. TaxID=78 RepID=UPI001B0FC52D|nr:AcvB/VirJ family lysyl-phosphatidylglycerol hydrolase [Caulobacter sp.]MBO9544016.1 virulence factor [Caulobacter sp.]